MWQYILSQECGSRPVSDVELPFNEKSVRYHWLKVSQEEWRLDSDPIVSARKFLSEHGAQHQIKMINIQEAPGTRVLAFEVADFMDCWAKNTQELAMDSTCEWTIFPCQKSFLNLS